MANGTENRKLYGLLGRNIGYSLSPVMHNAAFVHFGIPGKYRLFDIEPDELDGFFRKSLLTGKIDGINVTVPYKGDIIRLLKDYDHCDVDRMAEFLGAVNTLKADGPKLTGYNTDAGGFYESLLRDNGIVPKDKNIFVLGAGGAGSAICRFLACLGEDAPRKIYVSDIEEAKLKMLESACNGKAGREICEAVGISDKIVKMSGCELLINATPLGTKEGDPLPFDPGHLSEGQVVYDLVYARETELIKRAKEKDLKVINGLGMLVNQGALAFEIWTGKSLEETRKVMKEAALGELSKRTPCEFKKRARKGP